MGKVVDMPAGEIIIERTSEEFLSTARELGDYLNSLPLSNLEHNTLIKLITAQICAAERSAYAQGVGLGVAIGKDGTVNK